MIIQFIKIFTLEIIVFYLYRWLVYMIHEIAHCGVAKLFAYKCHIKIGYSKLFMPRCSAIVRGKRKLTYRQDLMFSFSGIALSEIFTICLIILFKEYDYLVLIWVAHIPILFLDMIPLGGNDGEWIVKDFAQIYGWKKKSIDISKKIIVILAFLLLIVSILSNVYILFNMEGQKVWICSLFVIIFAVTTFRCLWKNGRDVWYES